MAVLNIHERLLPVGEDRAGELLESLSGPDDRLWPVHTCEPMILDRGLDVGSAGGHGPVRYTVASHRPGRSVRFAFTGPRGFLGFHEFTVDPAPGGQTLMRHTLAMRTVGPARFSWPLAYRWAHDAVLEDAFDKAERHLTGTVARPYRHRPYARLLFGLARMVQRKR
ncbi:SRPBCC family protein [Kitasatospora sp. NPDC054939]